MNCENEALDLVKKLFVNNDEYDFKNEKDANQFAKELLSCLENTYSSEGYHHKYKTLEAFMYTHHADSVAYWLFEEKYC
ncbi:hypothetical protein ACFVS2_26030 [Brevibacillus sp. NPDC058079]|uniref:hypothetical protein n=1 Tax=Brevibacillus sp. NPDC058079 TaxID=3346330 RepID=UPI0036E4BC5A